MRLFETRIHQVMEKPESQISQLSVFPLRPDVNYVASGSTHVGSSIPGEKEVLVGSCSTQFKWVRSMIEAEMRLHRTVQREIFVKGDIQRLQADITSDDKKQSYMYAAI